MWLLPWFYLTHRWATTIKSKEEGLAVSLDIVKAFLRVLHGAFLACENLCNWIHSFLTERCIKVIVVGFLLRTDYVNAVFHQSLF